MTTSRRSGSHLPCRYGREDTDSSGLESFEGRDPRMGGEGSSRFRPGDADEAT
jgi:hypothetical protein